MELALNTAAIILPLTHFAYFYNYYTQIIAFIHCILLLYMEIYLSTAFKGVLFTCIFSFKWSVKLQ